MAATAARAVSLRARLRTMRTGMVRTGVLLTAAVPCRGGRNRALDISVLLQGREARSGAMAIAVL
jgi:hypothetical protein